MDLDDVIDCLSNYGQRATYGAVAGLLHRAPNGLMAGRRRSIRDSWVVSRATGFPSGYHAHEIDPRLSASPPPIADTVALQHWLAAHCTAGR